MSRARGIWSSRGRGRRSGRRENGRGLGLVLMLGLSLFQESEVIFLRHWRRVSGRGSETIEEGMRLSRLRIGGG